MEAARSSHDARSVTSQAKLAVSEPIAVAVRWAAASSMSAATTRAPAFAIAWAIASPIPEPAPVISASRPSSKPFMSRPYASPLPPSRERAGVARRLHRGHAGGAALGQRRSWFNDRRRLDFLGRARQCPIPFVRTHLVVSIVLRRVAIDHVAIMERVGNAADLVLDR